MTFSMSGATQPALAEPSANEVPTTTRVSVSSIGEQGDSPYGLFSGSGKPSISDDGRYVAFSSNASNLVENDTNYSYSDVFVHDRVAGSTFCISVTPSGAHGDKGSDWPSISADGRYVAFASEATNLVPGDTNGAKDIFVSDWRNGTLTRIFVSAGGSQANEPSDRPAISSDGRRVAFQSFASNLVPNDTNGVWDIFVSDWQTGEVQRVSVGMHGEQANGESYWPAISSDGNVVAFASDATNLSTPDTNWRTDIFWRDLTLEATGRVFGWLGDQPNGDNDQPSLSADGRFIAYRSLATNMIDGYSGALGSQIYVYDTWYYRSTLISHSGSGSPGNDYSNLPVFSRDGKVVVFSSMATNLVHGDINGKEDIFMRRWEPGAQVQLVSLSYQGQQGNADSYWPSVANDGAAVAFSSWASNLVPNDTNGWPDVFVRQQSGALPARTPLVIIPGIMGSRLFHDENGAEVEVWANVNKISALFYLEHPLMVLALAADGFSPAKNDPEYTSVRIKSGLAGLLTRIQGSAWGMDVDEDVYDGLIQHYVDRGYTVGSDLFVHPYDWRKDLRLAAAELDSLIETIRTQTGSPKVQIIAHSMGGLVTRHYLTDAARAGKVDRVVILGTPFLGTPKAYNTLLNGDCINEVGVGPLTLCFPDPQCIKALVPNLPGFYQLMPSQAYFTVKGGGFYGLGQNVDVTGQCTECLDYSSTYVTHKPANLNSSIFVDAANFHLGVDRLTGWNGVPVSIVGGENHQTIGGVREYADWERVRYYSPIPPFVRYLYVPVTRRAPVYTTAGDGTVTRHSVSLANPELGVNLRGSATFCAFETTHLGMVLDPDVQRYADGELGLIARQPCPPLQGLAAGHSGDPAGAQITAHGAARIEVRDAADRYTGPDETSSFVALGIPGSVYWDGEGVVSVGLLGGQTYTVTVVPADVGPVDITLERWLGDEEDSRRLYLGLMGDPATRIVLIGDPWQVDTWQVDVLGDGSNVQPASPDIILTPADPIDTTPPHVSIILEGERDASGKFTSSVTITIEATDAQSGISRVDYCVGDTCGVYTTPFTTQAQPGFISARAADGAGNVGGARIPLNGSQSWLPLLGK